MITYSFEFVQLVAGARRQLSLAGVSGALHMLHKAEVADLASSTLKVPIKY